MTLNQFGRKLFTVAGVVGVAAMMFVAACGTSSTGSNSSSVNTSLTACHVTAADLTLSTSSTTPAAPTAVTGLSGQQLTIDGSSALQPFFVAAAKYFDQGQGTHTTAVANGSGNGLKDVESGAVQIGMSDFFYQQDPAVPNPSTVFADLVDHQVAVVPFSLVVSKDISSQIENLTTQEIVDIYTGKVTNWSQIGGPNELVTVINRPLVSGTRATFRKYVLNGATESAGTTLTQDTTGAVAAALSTTNGAIGYVANGFVLNPQYSSSIFPICINGFGATSQNINSGSYLYWSFEHAYTKGTPAANSAAQQFLNYVVTAPVQNSLLPQLGYLQVSNLTQAALATHPAPTN